MITTQTRDQRPKPEQSRECLDHDTRRNHEDYRKLATETQLRRFSAPPSSFDASVVCISGSGPIIDGLREAGLVTVDSWQPACNFNHDNRTLVVGGSELDIRGLSENGKLPAYNVDVVADENGVALRVTKNYADGPPIIFRISPELFRDPDKLSEFFHQLRGQLEQIYSADSLEYSRLCNQLGQKPGGFNQNMTLHVVTSCENGHINLDGATLGAFNVNISDVREVTVKIPLSEDHIKTLQSSPHWERLTSGQILNIDGQHILLINSDEGQFLVVLPKAQRSGESEVSFHVDLRELNLPISHTPIFTTRLKNSDDLIVNIESVPFKDPTQLEQQYLEAINGFEKAFGIQVFGEVNVTTQIKPQFRRSTRGGDTKTTVELNPTIGELEKVVLNHELAHWLHFHDPSIGFRLFELQDRLRKAIEDRNLPEASSSVVFMALNESYVHGKTFEVLKHPGVSEYIRCVESDSRFRVSAFPRMYPGHTFNGADEIFSSVTSLILSDEQVWRDWLGRIARNNGDIEHEIFNLFPDVWEPLSTHLRNINANKMSAEELLGVVDEVVQAYQEILNNSAMVPQSAEIFKRIEQFRSVLREYRAGRLF